MRSTHITDLWYGIHVKQTFFYVWMNIVIPQGVSWPLKFMIEDRHNISTNFLSNTDQPSHITNNGWWCTNWDWQCHNWIWELWTIFGFSDNSSRFILPRGKWKRLDSYCLLYIIWVQGEISLISELPRLGLCHCYHDIQEILPDYFRSRYGSNISGISDDASILSLLLFCELKVAIFLSRLVVWAYSLFVDEISVITMSYMIQPYA